MRPADLRLRLVAAFAVIACIAPLHSLPVAAAALAAAVLLALLGGRVSGLAHRLLHVEAFLLLLFATLPFTVPGETLFTLGPLAASREGVWRAALIACKVSASVLVLTALLGDVEPARLGAALRALHVPERLTRLLVTTVRYAGLLRAEAGRLHEAMRARGFRPRSTRHGWRSLGNLMGMLLVRALERAHRVEEAMLCRGYQGHFPTRALPRPAKSDWIAFAALTAGGMLVLAADRL